MGYETTLLIVERPKVYNSPNEYCSIIAAIDLSKAAYNKFGELICRCTRKDDNKINDIRSYESFRQTVFTSDGDYTEDLQNMSKAERDAEIKKMWDLENAIGLPYVYYSNKNIMDFTDDYGDVLMFASVEDTLDALVRDQAHSISTGEYSQIYGYRRFDAAIALLRAFTNKEAWPNVEVVLWGH